MTKRQEPLPLRECRFCGKTFRPTTKKSWLCSKNCYHGAWAAKNKDHLTAYRKRHYRKHTGDVQERPCAVCGKMFLPIRIHRKYCSDLCRHRAVVPPRPRTAENHGAKCSECGTVFVQRRPTNKWCSPICYARYWDRTNRAYANERMRKFHAKAKKRTPWLPLLLGAKDRARKSAFEYELTREWASIRWTGCCEITGLPFEYPEKHRTPMSPSIDRINSDIGYTQANSRFILWGLNLLKNVGTDEEVRDAIRKISQSKFMIESGPPVGIDDATNLSSLTMLLHP